MVKVISLSDAAYLKLKRLKGDKSFSEVVVEIVDEKTTNKKRKNLMDFFGIFKENSEEWEKIKKRIYEDRKKFELRDYKW